MIGLPNICDLIVMDKFSTVGVVVNRIDGKRGSRLTIMAGSEGCSLTTNTRPMTRLPDGWTAISAADAYERLTP